MGDFHGLGEVSFSTVSTCLRLLRRLRRTRQQQMPAKRARMRSAPTIQPTMMPILAPLLSPPLAAAAVWEGVAAAGGGVEVIEGEVLDEDDDAVSLASADLTTLTAEPAAPMKSLRGLDVVAAACPATLTTFANAIPTDKRICRSIVTVGDDDVGLRRLLREQGQLRVTAIL